MDVLCPQWGGGNFNSDGFGPGRLEIGGQKTNQFLRKSLMGDLLRIHWRLSAILKTSNKSVWSYFLWYIRSSRPEVFCKKGVLRNFAKSTGKHLYQNFWPATLLKARLWHRCFPVNFTKFLRAPFLTEHLRWLLLICKSVHILNKVYSIHYTLK